MIVRTVWSTSALVFIICFRANGTSPKSSSSLYRLGLFYCFKPSGMCWHVKYICNSLLQVSLRRATNTRSCIQMSENLGVTVYDYTITSVVQNINILAKKIINTFQNFQYDTHRVIFINPQGAPRVTAVVLRIRCYHFNCCVL